MKAEEKAVVILDLFTKTFCREEDDYKKYNDLKFRCNECPFENHDDGRCYVKMFKQKYMPSYENFGSICD